VIIQKKQHEMKSSNNNSKRPSDDGKNSYQLPDEEIRLLEQDILKREELLAQKEGEIQQERKLYEETIQRLKKEIKEVLSHRKEIAEWSVNQFQYLEEETYRSAELAKMNLNMENDKMLETHQDLLNNYQALFDQQEWRNLCKKLNDILYGSLEQLQLRLEYILPKYVWESFERGQKVAKALNYIKRINGKQGLSQLMATLEEMGEDISVDYIRQSSVNHLFVVGN